MFARSMAAQVAVCLTLVLAAPISAAERHVESADFDRICKSILDIIESEGADRVLVAFDLDNTLLAMNQDLGSDQWFTWQEQLLESEPDSPHLTAPAFDGLLKVQGKLFAISGMHPPEPKIPACVQAVQGTGAATIVLSARGFEFTCDAVDELNDNGLDFSETALPIDGKTPRGRFLPYGSGTSAGSPLSPSQIERLGLGDPRLVSYGDGVFAVAGQHKGAMLLSLLARSDKPIDTICFVDDKMSHCGRVREAFESSDIEAFTFRYTREDGKCARFHGSPKTHVVRQWSTLREAMDGSLVP